MCKIELCKNRITQKGIDKILKIDYISREKGFGVFSACNIKKDDFVCEYVGLIINNHIAKEKIYSNFVRKKPNYVLQIRENYEKIIVNTFIDAEEKGNVSRFLNHSCQPNLYFDIIRVGSFIPQVAFFALRDIKEGEELTFCYSDNTEKDDTFDLSYKQCLCGEMNCIKYLPC
jgi:SET domain-containing protein